MESSHRHTLGGVGTMAYVSSSICLQLPLSIVKP
jgi:hypothetical protein